MKLGLIISLARRNLTRNFRRTAITSAAVVAGVAVLIVGFGLVDGLDENVIRTQEDSVSSHLLLRPTDYPTDGLNFPLDQAQQIDEDAATALASSDVEAWTARLWFTGRIISGMDSIRIKGIAYDPVGEDDVFDRSRWLVTNAQSGGQWPSQPNEIALSSGVAKLLEVNPGQNVTIETRTLPGAINAMTYTVSGIIQTGNPGVDTFGVWIPRDTANTLLVSENIVSHVAVRLKRRGLAENTKPLLSSGGWVASTSIEEVSDLLALNAFRRKAIELVVFILMAIAATGIANTVIMAAYERVREVGTLRAMGMTRWGIRALFIIEGGVMGLTAGVLGSILGAGIVEYFAATGIDLGALTDTMGELSMSSMLYMQFSWGPIWGSIVFGVLISIIASLYPAHHAANLNPADAVRAI